MPVAIGGTIRVLRGGTVETNLSKHLGGLARRQRTILRALQTGNIMRLALQLRACNRDKRTCWLVACVDDGDNNPLWRNKGPRRLAVGRDALMCLLV